MQPALLQDISTPPPALYQIILTSYFDFAFFLQKLGIDRRYQIHLKSHTGEINVLLVNKDPMNNRPVVTPVPPPMPVSSVPHNTSLTKENPQIPLVTEKITTVAEKPPEMEKSMKKPIPMETGSSGSHNCLQVFSFFFQNVIVERLIIQILVDC